MKAKKKSKNPGGRVPPVIGPAVAEARERMSELYEAIAPKAIKQYGKRGKEVAARTAWTQFKREYRKVAGRWIKRKNPLPADPAKRGKHKNADGPVVAAARMFEKAHWGLRPKFGSNKKINVPKAVAQIGKLTAIEYETAKGNEGKGVYRHVFSAPLPDLCSSPDGKQLFILGGGYKVKPEGIVH